MILFSITHGCTDIPGEKLICVTFMFQTYVIFVFQIYPKLYIYINPDPYPGHGTNCGIYPPDISKKHITCNTCLLTCSLGANQEHLNIKAWP